MQRPAKPFTPVRFRLQPPDFMKIGIIGYGFVGEALASSLKTNVQVFKVDPKLNTNIDDLKKFDPDTVFVCVPTPMNEDGSVDSKILLSVLEEIKIKDLNCLIVLKSTIHPGIIKRIDNLIGEFVYNPEFLREKHAKSDFINSEFILFGGKKKSSSVLAKIYSENTKCKNKNYIYTDAISASLLKYAVNSFLATKVIFFNQFKELFDNSGAQEDWKKFIEYLKHDKRIGDSHMDVPGHDGRLGFGGACFPKDTEAIVKYADEIGVNLELIKKSINANNKIRAKYNTKTDREVDQNITFKK